MLIKFDESVEMSVLSIEDSIKIESGAQLSSCFSLIKEMPSGLK